MENLKNVSDLLIKNTKKKMNHLQKCYSLPNTKQQMCMNKMIYIESI
jgi:hypothetical protein